MPEQYRSNTPKGMPATPKDLYEGAKGTYRRLKSTLGNMLRGETEVPPQGRTEDIELPYEGRMSDMIGDKTSLGFQQNANPPATPVPGLIEPGNITDLGTRPLVDFIDDSGKNAKGTIYSSTIQEDYTDPNSLWVLIPTIYADPDGISRKHSNAESEAQYRETGLNLGKFKTLEENVAYAKALSSEQEKRPRN